jgi:hypothetical protein
MRPLKESLDFSCFEVFLGSVKNIEECTVHIVLEIVLIVWCCLAHTPSINYKLIILCIVHIFLSEGNLGIEARPRKDLLILVVL